MPALPSLSLLARTVSLSSLHWRFTVEFACSAKRAVGLRIRRNYLGESPSRPLNPEGEASITGYMTL